MVFTSPTPSHSSITRSRTPAAGKTTDPLHNIVLSMRAFVSARKGLPTTTFCDRYSSTSNSCLDQTVQDRTKYIQFGGPPLRYARYVRRPARFFDDDGADSDSEHDRGEESRQKHQFDVDIRNWYESECFQSMALNGAVSTGVNVSTLSNNILPPGNTMLFYWDFSAQAKAQDIPDDDIAKYPQRRTLLRPGCNSSVRNIEA
jgi:hypothetical protein